MGTIKDEIFNEILLLKARMQRDSRFKITFGQVIFALTRRIDRKDLLEISDDDFIKHIQKIQVLES